MDERFYHEQATIETNHWWYKGRRLIIRDFLKNKLATVKISPARILDVGCGTGAMHNALSPLGEIIGVDSSSIAIAHCNKKNIYSVKLAPSEKLPFKDESFDVLTALDILEHLDNEKVNLLEWQRVVRNDGYILITVPAFNWLWGNQDIVSHHRRRYTRRNLATVIRESGLKIERITYFSFFMFPIIAIVRLSYNLLRKFGFQAKVKSDFSIGPDILNYPLSMIFYSELGLFSFFDLPFGSSILCLCKVNHK